ncbi:hypothetical protein Taro_014500 [Colocasia esculenta]|uniref:tRNA pseudouridine(55) synthase n=1 Tax=Colocasia esculenta TaxID=4460 RepID=A0A843UF24_COLES|nr:hypothetical protein [Colocasia esculenta]
MDDIGSHHGLLERRFGPNRTGWTSFTVCGKLRRQVKVQKVGHAGTLDPMATGLLIVCVGKATKLVERPVTSSRRAIIVFNRGSVTNMEMRSCLTMTPQRK